MINNHPENYAASHNKTHRGCGTERRIKQTEPVMAGIAYLDGRGKITQTNRRLQQLLGYSEAELKGRTLRDLCHPSDLTRTLDTLDRLSEGFLVRHQTLNRLIHKNHRVVYCRFIGSICPGQTDKEPVTVRVSLEHIATVDDETWDAVRTAASARSDA